MRDHQAIGEQWETEKVQFMEVCVWSWCPSSGHRPGVRKPRPCTNRAWLADSGSCVAHTRQCGQCVTVSSWRAAIRRQMPQFRTSTGQVKLMAAALKGVEEFAEDLKALSIVAFDFNVRAATHSGEEHLLTRLGEHGVQCAWFMKPESPEHPTVLN